MKVSLPTLGIQPPPASDQQRLAGDLRDSHGRVITDLRLSVTDRCNFRCIYCLEPDTRFLPRQELLYREEYVQIIEACHELGVRSLRITGGEPTLYPELDALIEQVGGIGLEDIAMTTNGWSLDLDRARHWRASGLKRLTFSLDSLREDRMSEITRSKTSVRQVFEAIATARSAGFPRPKVNVVVMRHVNDDEVVDFATTARQHDLDIRFIEFMPLDSARDWDRGQVVTAEEIRRKIDAVWPLTRSDDGNPHSTSNNWSFSDGQPGRIGFIAPVSRPFCGACNRLRITAEGRIRPCLFSHDEWDLKPLLRRGVSMEHLRSFIVDAAWNKQPGHRIGQGDFQQPARSMSAIGG